MKTTKIYKNLKFILVLLLNICLVTAVVVLMKHAQNLLNSDIEVNLMEVVTQNKDVITSKLMLEMNNLQNFSSEISNAMPQDAPTEGNGLQNVINGKVLDNGEKELFVADKNGIGYFRDGTTIDISGRKYFKLAIEGTQNISDKLISRVDGIEKFVISVPIYQNDTIIGTVQKSFTHDEMYEICSVSLFSSQGYMYIINSEGYSILSTSYDRQMTETDNFYRDLYSEGNKQQTEKLTKDIKSNKAGFMKTTVAGEEIFSAYTPINQIHDWYLITSVPIKAVSGNGTTVINLFYVILLSVVVIFAVSLLYFLQYKNKQKENLEKIAFIDPVTGGNTYSKFTVEAEKVLYDHQNKKYAILKFDLDNFRYVNSYYGFEFGDKLLYKIYHKLAGELSGHEVIGRISGDNFVVFLEEFSEERVNALLNSLYDEEFTIYISAGLYIISDTKESINLMMDKASIAARSVKGILNKRLQYYSKEFDAISIKSEQLKRAVTQALANDEFIPFYQPKVDIITGTVVGAEALARWKNSDNKLVSPAEFIPMSEKTGIIVEIDMMIFEKVLQFLNNNIKEGNKCVPVSVNFSRVHLHNKEFLKKLKNKMDQYQVPAKLIEIELTESAIFDNRSIIFNFTNDLRMLGIRIAIDDFGSGYSSLNMLKDIPIDVLKIDREFLTGSADDGRRDIIFASVVEMANKLGIEIVVEGVEFIENVELMKTCGCNVAQGYYFARPMEEKQFIDYSGR